MYLFIMNEQLLYTENVPQRFTGNGTIRGNGAVGMFIKNQGATVATLWGYYAMAAGDALPLIGDRCERLMDNIPFTFAGGVGDLVVIRRVPIPNPPKHRVETND